MTDLSPENLKKLQKLARVVDGGSVGILEHLSELEDELSARIDELKASLPNLDEVLASIRGNDGKDGLEGPQGPRGEKGDRGDPGARGEQGKAGKDGRDGRDGRDAVDGRDGVDGKDGAAGSPDTADDIRNKLELLPDGEKLSLDAIEGLRAWLESLPAHEKGIVIGANRNLYQLLDMNLAGITPGQTILWNGQAWVPYTPTGGGGTAVYGEVLQSQAPTGTVFTLAHPPLTGTVRLFRGGTRQSAANGDYSITGATITLTSALQSGETLVADYTY